MKAPELVVADLDIIKGAPARLVASGINDILAKYISLVDWRIAKIVDGEYYCPMVAELAEHALALMQAMDIEVDCIDLGAASDRTIAFLGGQCDILEGLYSQGKEYIESGEFVPLCVLGNERNENFPDIPCSGELGFDFGAEWFYYFGFKKGTDPAIIETFTNAVKEAVEMEPYSNALDLYNFHANFQPGEDGVKFMQGVEEVYAPMAEALLAE